MLGIPNAPHPACLGGLPVLWHRGQQKTNVGGPCDVHHCPEQIRTRFTHSQCEIPASGYSEDTHALRIRIALLDSPLCGVDEVIPHFQAELVIARIEEGFAETDRAAIFDLHNGVAAIGQELDDGIEVLMIASPRAAVGKENEWCGPAAHGSCQVHRQLETVAC